MRVFPGIHLTTMGLVMQMLSACGASLPPDERTIVSSTATSETTTDSPDRPDTDSGGTEPPDDLKAQLIKDGRTAVRLLLRLACEDPSDRGVFAAVYALRMGLEPELSCTESALHRGARSESLLLRALSRQYLLLQKEVSLPENTMWTDEDPAVRVLGALAYLYRGVPLPETLTYSLSLPNEPPTGTDKHTETNDRIARLSAMAAPFDDGLLTGAVLLSESLYEKTAELSEGRTVWTALRLRGALLDALGIAPAKIPSLPIDMPAPDLRPSKLGELLENQLSQNSAQTLGNIALNAPPALRVQALRALTIIDGPPSAVALVAAAAALRSDDIDVRLEGARTFLWLVRQFGR